MPMTTRNIFAWTRESFPYPEFVSLNERDGKITLTVREVCQPGPHSDQDCGQTIEIELPPEQVLRLGNAIAQWHLRKTI